MAAKLSEMKPDVIHFSTCLSSAKPDCPYTKPEDLAQLVENKTGIKVVMGTRDYH
jgi:predicted metal-binding protein